MCLGKLNFSAFFFFLLNSRLSKFFLVQRQICTFVRLKRKVVFSLESRRVPEAAWFKDQDGVFRNALRWANSLLCQVNAAPIVE